LQGVSGIVAAKLAFMVHYALTPVANRAFQVVGPRTWKDLPDYVTSAESLSTFHHALKTHLFTGSFFWLFPGLDFI